MVRCLDPELLCVPGRSHADCCASASESAYPEFLWLRHLVRRRQLRCRDNRNIRQCPPRSLPRPWHQQHQHDHRQEVQLGRGWKPLLADSYGKRQCLQPYAVQQSGQPVRSRNLRPNHFGSCCTSNAACSEDHLLNNHNITVTRGAPRRLSCGFWCRAGAGLWKENGDQALPAMLFLAATFIEIDFAVAFLAGTATLLAAFFAFGSASLVLAPAGFALAEAFLRAARVFSASAALSSASNSAGVSGRTDLRSRSMS